MLRTGLRELKWLEEFPRRNVYFRAGGKTLRQICRRIVSRIQRRRTHPSFRCSSAAQLIPKLTEIIARRIALAVSGKQIVGTGCRREKEEARHSSLSANLGNDKRRAVAVIDQQDQLASVDLFFNWNVEARFHFPIQINAIQNCATQGLFVQFFFL